MLPLIVLEVISLIEGAGWEEIPSPTRDGRLFLPPHSGGHHPWHHGDNIKVVYDKHMKTMSLLIHAAHSGLVPCLLSDQTATVRKFGSYIEIKINAR